MKHTHRELVLDPFGDKPTNRSYILMFKKNNRDSTQHSRHRDRVYKASCIEAMERSRKRWAGKEHLVHDIGHGVQNMLSDTEKIKASVNGALWTEL